MNKQTQKTLFSSVKQDWETPEWLFYKLNLEFRFDLDVCATKENAKCVNFFSPEDDALTRKWTGTCWMNPPYGREIKKWIKHAYECASAGDATVVALVPARTDTAYFHDYIYNKPNVEIRFLRGRLQFVGAKHKAPFPSMVVVFRPNT